MHLEKNIHAEMAVFERRFREVAQGPGAGAAVCSFAEFAVDEYCLIEAAVCEPAIDKAPAGDAGLVEHTVMEVTLLEIDVVQGEFDNVFLVEAQPNDTIVGPEDLFDRYR